MTPIRTDIGDVTLAVATLDDGGIKGLHRNGIDQPRALVVAQVEQIAIHPRHGEVNTA